MTENLCVGCRRPVADANACTACANDLATQLLAAAGHAEDAQAVIARQARYGTSGTRSSSDEPMPADLTASAKLQAVTNTVDTWRRDLNSDRPLPRWRRTAGPTCVIGVRCKHRSCAQARAGTPTLLAQMLTWLAEHVTAIARHRAAGEAYRDLAGACDQLARLNDRPPDKDLVGMCDCGKVLYAARGKVFVKCPERTCAQLWHVERSRDILRAALGDKLVTTPEAARLAAYLDTDRTQDNIRKLIDTRVRSGQLLAHGHVETDDGAEPTYRFGDVVVTLAQIPRRRPREAVVASA